MRTGKVSKKVGQREQLILALLQQPSLEKAAASIGISTVTAWRISKTKEFKEDYRNARWEAFSQSLARLQQASGAAVSALLKVMIDKTTRAARAPKANDFSGHSRGSVVLREGPGPGKATITTEGRLVQSGRHVEAALA